MTDAEVGQEVINFFLRLSDPISNMRKWQANKAVYMDAEVAAGRLHAQARTIIESGNTATVEAAMQAAQPGQTYPNVVFPPM